MDLTFEKTFPWLAIEDGNIPTAYAPIEMTGPSGYIAPNDRFVISGYYQPGYADPWRDCMGNGLEDNGWSPTHWRPLTPEPFGGVF